MAYILLYVDDIILITSTHALRQSIMSLLASEFAMKDLGPLSYFWVLPSLIILVAYFSIKAPMHLKSLTVLG